MQKKKIDNYTIYLDKKLGEGTFGKVYIGQQDKTHLKVAAKMLDKKSIDKDPYIKQALMSQIQILKLLKSDNIVGFKDVMQSANYYYVIQQYCQGGDLRGLMKKRGKIPEKQAIQILKQICNGFIEILKQGIIHRDLKPQNLLINKGVIKICDFGFAKKIHSQKFKNQTMVGTPLYMSIQILKGEPYTSKCDIWALGFIFYQLMNGITPWTANTQYQLIKNVQKKALKFLVDLSQTTKDFLTSCLKTYQKERISWDELLRHQIFGGYFSKYIKNQHQFQNKMKALMTQLRIKIKQQNIDLQRLFRSIGYTKQTQLRFQDFQRFLKTIDSKLTAQQQRYIFQKLDLDQSDSISFQQLQRQMINNYIPMKSKMKVQKKQSYTYGEEGTSQHQIMLNDMIQVKLVNAFLKLSQRMQKNKIKLHQVFDAYDVNKDGDMTIKQFSRIIKRIDESFTNQQLQRAFAFVDFDSSGAISFDEFHRYFCKATGEPFNNYMINQQTSSGISYYGAEKKESLKNNGKSKSSKQ